MQGIKNGGNEFYTAHKIMINMRFFHITNTIIFKIEYIFLAITCIAALFSFSVGMTDTQIIPKQLFTTLTFSVTIIIISIKYLLKQNTYIDFYSYSIIITCICSIEAMFVIFQWLLYSSLNISTAPSGSFENPAGLIACLCPVLPFSMNLLYTQNKHKRLILFCNIIILVAIIVSKSRTGIVASILFLLYFLLKTKKIALKKRVIILLVTLGVLIFFSYFINTNSADGRLLIWRISGDIISDTPWYGFGIGAFEKYYMDYQANYLMSLSPDNPYIMLADNVLVPFNEYINFYISFGILGSAILLVGIFVLIYIYHKTTKSDESIALFSLIIIAFISFFSYPFTYPLTFIFCALNVYFIIKDTFKWKHSKILSYIAILAGISCVLFSAQRIYFEYLWGKAYIKKDLVLYSKLNNKLNQSPHFLYSYAFELFDNKDYELAIEKALECKNLISHYDLELLLGDIYLKQNKFTCAEAHYLRASQMCPNRLIPLQALYDTYIAKEDFVKAKQIAYVIIDKPIKIPSRTTKLIKYRMRQAINNN